MTTERNVAPGPDSEWGEKYTKTIVKNNEWNYNI